MKIRNRFYVGHPKVGAPSEQDQNNIEGQVYLAKPGDPNGSGKWTRHTLKDAIAHAEQILEAGKQDHCVIVQIIRVVRRKKAPVTVETVR